MIALASYEYIIMWDVTFTLLWRRQWTKSTQANFESGRAYFPGAGEAPSTDRRNDAEESVDGGLTPVNIL
ncbi:hypothetical protein NM688_g5804 [Phlebia brevispora]|uniref:Uncharacterized protein n=1 Tax=Phlebia brevispora TaxID=194682 RepID=A0ACC1SPG2_9APHY|nr:hypothetical protein NM688_g5804 [Phlebia brevispora]